ncbi:MAG TPA: diguanylate cyclase [Magnetospirillaceae bacterium]|jgi:diguanylate cyclase (GGDEF)-like protein/PAS domain S-box-containing protein
MGTSYVETIGAWLALYAQNIALGLIPVILYGGLRTTLVGERKSIDSYLIGVLFGLGAITSMTFPIHTPEGLSVDGRIVFVLVGSLYGGEIGAALVTGIAAAYRYEIGGPGMWAGVAAIAVSGIYGYLIGRFRIERGRDFSFFPLAAIGLINVVITALTIILVQMAAGSPPMSLVTSATGFVVFPLGTAVLGIALSMTRNRVMWKLQKRINDIIETTSDLVWETDADDFLTYVSERHRAVLGFPLSRYKGHRPAELGGLWVDETTRRAHELAFERREAFNDLHSFAPTSAGETKVLSISGRPMFDDRGRFTGYRGTASDITERMRLDSELHRSLFRLERAQRMGKIGYIEVDLLTGKGIWSEEIYLLFGVDPSVAPSLERYMECIHPDDRDMTTALYEKNRQGLTLGPSEYRVVRPDGTTIWLRREVEVVRDDTGAPVRLFATEQDITERKRMELELAHLATIDPLTGALNRRHFLELAERQLARVRRGREAAAIVMIDLDHFKRINDTYGHAGGDAVLRRAVALCQSELRPEDIFGRLGGEEFAAVLSGCDHGTARQVVQRLLHSLPEAEIIAGDSAIRVTASFGISDLAPDDRTIADALARADHALYEAKGAGRNCMIERWSGSEPNEPVYATSPIGR